MTRRTTTQPDTQTTRRNPRRTAATRLGITLLSISAVLAGGATSPLSPPAHADATGEALTPEDLTYPALPAHLEHAYTAATLIAESDPHRYAGAWYDGQQIVLNTSADTTHNRPVLPDNTTLRRVTRSQHELAQLQERLTQQHLQGGASGKVDTWVVFTDARLNSVIVGASQPHQELIASVHNAGGRVAQWDNPGLTPLARNNDTSPYSGGAEIGPTACSSGLPWTGQGVPALISAGHCAPTGGTITAGSGTLGTVTAGSGENWTTGTGTALLPGDTTYRGDIAVVKAATGNTTQGRIYIGGPGSNTRRAVGGMWARSPAVNDTYCTSGAASGETCTWTVTLINANVTYSTGEIARNMTVGTSPSACLSGGDSGGPVHTIRSTDNKAIAKGIISGGSSSETGCAMTFTDARLISARYGGGPQTA